jgi:hypothetical protein
MIGNNKIFRGSTYDNNNNYTPIKYGEVISVDDPKGLGRIKVRIKGPTGLGGDDDILAADLPWCFPLIPKHIYIQPKISESVIIITFSKDRQHTDRLYIGPIISQEQKLDFDAHFGTALAGFSFGTQDANVNVNTIPELKGVFPDPKDISIQGRNNTDITQKNNEIIIRAGKFISSIPSSENPYPFKFNTSTQGYIQIKNDIPTKKVDDEVIERGTITTIVSNKINLITHRDGQPRFNVTNQNDLISEEEIEKILNEAHQLPFGDILLEYLRLLKDALFYHVHNGHGNAATDLTSSGNKQALAAFKAKADDLEKRMLSNNIRIN